MCFASEVLKFPDKQPNNSQHLPLTTLVNRQVRTFMVLEALSDIALIPESPYEGSSATDEDEMKKIGSAKFAENDIKGAVRVISGSQGLAPFNERTLSQLKELNPSQPEGFKLLPPPDDKAPQFQATCTEEQAKAEIKKSTFSSAAGPDGLRPAHLKTLLGPASSAQGTRLLTALTNLFNDVLVGEVPKIRWPLFNGGSLCALTKDSGGIRPIAAGNTLRR